MLRALVGALIGSGGGADLNHCTGYGVISDYALPMMGPIRIPDATLDVRADPGKPVTFSNLRGSFTPTGIEMKLDYLVNALAQARSSVTAQHLRESRFRKVEVTGSHNSGSTSADGTVSSLVVNWKLTLRALPPRTVGIRSKR
jgi:hypothetical protein